MDNISKNMFSSSRSIDVNLKKMIQRFNENKNWSELDHALDLYHKRKMPNNSCEELIKSFSVGDKPR